MFFINFINYTFNKNNLSLRENWEFSFVFWTKIKNIKKHLWLLVPNWRIFILTHHFSFPTYIANIFRE